MVTALKTILVDTWVSNLNFNSIDANNLQIVNSMEPLISVIVPIYKVEKYLSQCIDSIIGQTYQHIEVILVDDGSPDECGNICDQYVTEDQRVIAIHKENGGLSDARNAGILACTGDYILFIDSDDYWDTNNFLQKIVDLLKDKNNPIDVIIFSWTNFYEEQNIFKEDSRQLDKTLISNKSNLEILRILIKNDLYGASAWNKCIRKDLIKDNNLFFKKGLLSEDIEWSGRLLACINNIDILKENAYVYRRGRKNSITSSVGVKNINDILNTIEDAIQYSKSIENDKTLWIYMSYFAFQYITLLISIHFIKNKSDRINLLEKISSLTFLLNYNLNKKVRIVQLMFRLFGLRITSIILTAYFKRKNKLN